MTYIDYRRIRIYLVNKSINVVYCVLWFTAAYVALRMTSYDSYSGQDCSIAVGTLMIARGVRERCGPFTITIDWSMSAPSAFNLIH